MQHVVIVGAGIVGVSTGIWLQRAGYRVTIVDRDGPAAGASFGNAGVLAAGAFVPVTVPGILRKAPGMLWDADAPLFLRWGYLPRLLPWLRRYLGYARMDHVYDYARHMATLLADSQAQHKALAAGTGAERFIGDEDYVFGYPTDAAAQADAWGFDLRRDHGVRFTAMSGRDYQDIDPIFGNAFARVVICHDHGRISDPGAYLQALFNHLIAQGAAFERATVEDVIRDSLDTGVIRALKTDRGLIEGDAVVLATGAWSKPLAARLGADLPLEAERGYHIELIEPSATPKNPVMVAQGKFVITPMDGRIRCAGVVEFGGLTPAKSAAPLAMLRRQVARFLPDVTYTRMDDWVGHRPALASSFPVLGPTAPGANSYLALGHQHVGLTGGPKSGRIIADQITGVATNLDLTAFDPAQYKKDVA